MDASPPGPQRFWVLSHLHPTHIFTHWVKIQTQVPSEFSLKLSRLVLSRPHPAVSRHWWSPQVEHVGGLTNVQPHPEHRGQPNTIDRFHYTRGIQGGPGGGETSLTSQVRASMIFASSHSRRVRRSLSSSTIFFTAYSRPSSVAGDGRRGSGMIPEWSSRESPPLLHVFGDCISGHRCGAVAHP